MFQIAKVSMDNLVGNLDSMTLEGASAIAEDSKRAEACEGKQQTPCNCPTGTSAARHSSVGAVNPRAAGALAVKPATMIAKPKNGAVPAKPTVEFAGAA